MDTHEAVKRHHCLVEEKGYEVVMTVLVGSQNYELDVESSDVDTFSFVMPSFEDLALAREPVSGEFEVEDGKCMYKDMRLALNLLKKTSPNSVECFVSYYQYHNPKYEMVLYKYLSNENGYLNKMVHCNHSHMLYACAGMAHQLTKRNMPAGKRYSHALRLLSMVDVFTTSLDSRSLLTLLPRDYEEAKYAKRNNEAFLEHYYNSGCEYVAQKLDKVREEYTNSSFMEHVELEGQKLVKEFQQELFKLYLKDMLSEESKWN